MQQKNNLRALLNRQKLDAPPLCSGLISVTEAGLEGEGLLFHGTHHNAVVMERAAVRTYRVSGFGVDA